MRRACFLLTIFSCHLPALTQAQPVESPTIDEEYSSLILAEWKRYPLMELRDLYKFVYQSAMGPGHAVHDTTEAREWMEHEVAGLSPLPDFVEPTIAPLQPDSGLVRVNLRPYLENGGNTDVLLRSFIETANEYEPSVDQLRRDWSVVIDLAQSGRIPVDADSARALFDTMAGSDFPAVHHSRRYSEAYHPAYRVVEKALVPEFRRR